MFCLEAFIHGVTWICSAGREWGGTVPILMLTLEIANEPNPLKPSVSYLIHDILWVFVFYISSVILPHLKNWNQLPDIASRIPTEQTETHICKLILIFVISQKVHYTIHFQKKILLKNIFLFHGSGFKGLIKKGALFSYKRSFLHLGSWSWAVYPYTHI